MFKNPEEVKRRLEKWSVPEPMSGCILWTGDENPNGYGRMTIDKKGYIAHRVSYQLHIGNIGKFFVCHKCDVRSCINPAHLFLGTALQNMQDKARKGRARNQYRDATKCIRGHEFTKENTFLWQNGEKNKKIKRVCKICEKSRRQSRISKSMSRSKVSGVIT